MKLPKITLWLTAAGFLLFGVLFLVNPRLLENTGAQLLTPTSRFEVRSFYGGMEIGIGVFFLLAALQQSWQRVAIYAQVLIFGGLVGGRILSLVLDGVPTPDLLLFMSLEVLALLLGIFSLRLPTRPVERT